MLARTKEFISRQLRQGGTPEGLALTFAVGFFIAVFPLLGTTTILCVIFGHRLKLNQPSLQAVNYLLAPLQLIMIPIFLKVGAWICRMEAVSINPKVIVMEFIESPTKFLTSYGNAGLQAIFAWMLIAPWCSIIIYFICLHVIKKLKRLREV